MITKVYRYMNYSMLLVEIDVWLNGKLRLNNINITRFTLRLLKV